MKSKFLNQIIIINCAAYQDLTENKNQLNMFKLKFIFEYF